ncbi:MAG: M28 family peptidase [Muribaculaceae bacterium]|nr:M28 family peptidase [Muribaculaceae bacterium]
MGKWKFLAACFLASLLATEGCKSSTQDSSAKAKSAPTGVRSGSFSGDSAYAHVAAQVAFGPRVPGSKGHADCRQYIVDRLNAYNADTVIVQDATVKAYNGDILPISNIIAQYNRTNIRRILLAAHWDTRPWADQDDNAADRDKPIPGANDGASGVAVLLEIARNLAARMPAAGVDLIFFDAEDYGHSGGFENHNDTWCLGSQHWAKDRIPYTTGNLPVYGILLDMVGGRDARFHYEAFAHQNAPTPTLKVWSEAKRLGYGDMFVNSIGGIIIDDHVVLTRAGIPTTDIIELNNVATSSFPPTWHTHDDDLEHIDPEVLEAVGQTVLNVAYNEKPF